MVISPKSKHRNSTKKWGELKVKARPGRSVSTKRSLHLSPSPPSCSNTDHNKRAFIARNVNGKWHGGKSLWKSYQGEWMCIRLPTSRSTSLDILGLKMVVIVLAVLLVFISKLFSLDECWRHKTQGSFCIHPVTKEHVWKLHQSVAVTNHSLLWSFFVMN